MKQQFLRFLKFFWVVSIGILFFICQNAAWATNLDKAILGKWRKAGRIELIEFLDDGTVVITSNNDDQMSGNYRVLDEARIRIDVEGVYRLPVAQVVRVSLANDILVLDKLFEERSEYRKVTKATKYYLDGLTLYIDKKFDEAVKLFEIAADQGELEALEKLAYMYFNGLGVKQNKQNAIMFYHKAAKQGAMLSQRNLGYLYRKGLGAEKNIEKAIYWYQKAADQGDIKAHKELGWIYATSENPRYRSAEKALAHARIAYSKEGNEWGKLVVLAAAYARSGLFDHAVSTQQQAINKSEYTKISQEEKVIAVEHGDILLRLYENHLSYDGFDLDEVIARAKEENEKPNIPDSDFDTAAWVGLSRGEEKGDFCFREDGSLYYKDELFPSTVTAGYVNAQALNAKKLLISTPSPSKRYLFIKTLGRHGTFSKLYLADIKNKTLKPTFAGNGPYGPRETIYWASDERYATFKYYDEGHMFHYHVDLVTALSFRHEVVTLDTLAKDMDEHSRLALDTIRKNWKNLELKNEKRRTTAALAEITIKKNGKMTNVWFKQQSNIQAINDAAWKAIKKSDPLPALPGEYPESTRQMTISFSDKGVLDESKEESK